MKVNCEDLTLADPAYPDIAVVHECLGRLQALQWSPHTSTFSDGPAFCRQLAVLTDERRAEAKAYCLEREQPTSDSMLECVATSLE